MIDTYICPKCGGWMNVSISYFCGSPYVTYYCLNCEYFYPNNSEGIYGTASTETIWKVEENKNEKHSY